MVAVSGKHAASFWQSTWAMVTALATVLAALVGLAGFLVNQYRSGDLDTKWTQPPGDHPPVEHVVKIKERDVLWGPIEFRLEPFMSPNFDGPMLEREADYGPDLFTWHGSQVSSSYGLYLWPGKQPPTGTDCATFLATHGTGDHLNIEEGTTMCLRTNEGRVAVLAFKQRDGDNWLVDAKVWSPRVL